MAFLFSSSSGRLPQMTDDIPPGVTPFVFSDPAGKRWPRLRLYLLVGGVIAFVAAILFVQTLFVAPQLTLPFTLRQLKGQLKALEKQNPAGGAPHRVTAYPPSVAVPCDPSYEAAAAFASALRFTLIVLRLIPSILLRTWRSLCFSATFAGALFEERRTWPPNSKRSSGGHFRARSQISM